MHRAGSPRIHGVKGENLLMSDSARFAGKPWWQMPLTTSTFPAAARRVPEKGDHGGACQRIACENREAYWFNSTNGKYYCVACARTFNEVSRRNGQEPLCDLHPPAPAAAGTRTVRLPGAGLRPNH